MRPLSTHLGSGISDNVRRAAVTGIKPEEGPIRRPEGSPPESGNSRLHPKGQAEVLLLQVTDGFEASKLGPNGTTRDARHQIWDLLNHSREELVELPHRPGCIPFPGTICV